MDCLSHVLFIPEHKMDGGTGSGIAISVSDGTREQREAYDDRRLVFVDASWVKESALDRGFTNHHQERYLHSVEAAETPRE